MFDKPKQRFRLRQGIPGWYFFECLAVRSVAAFFNLLPFNVSVWMGERTGEILYGLALKRRKIALHNLDVAFGHSKSQAEKQKIVFDYFRHLGISLVELARLPKLFEKGEARFEIEGFEYMEQGFARGRGVLAAISHLGPWELLSFLPYSRKFSCSVVGRAIRNPYLYQWIQSKRQSVHLNPIDKDQSIRQVVSELRQNHCVAVLIDQWAGNEGLWIPFFRRKTSTTSFPARLALRTGCTLLWLSCVRLGVGRYRIHVRPEIPIDSGSESWEEAATQRLNHFLEEDIAAYPNQWIWPHRRWKETNKFAQV